MGQYTRQVVPPGAGWLCNEMTQCGARWITWTHDDPQQITGHDRKTAVVLSVSDYEHLRRGDENRRADRPQSPTAHRGENLATLQALAGAPIGAERMGASACECKYSEKEATCATANWARWMSVTPLVAKYAGKSRVGSLRYRADGSRQPPVNRLHGNHTR